MDEYLLRATNNNGSDGFTEEEELIRELLDNESPIFHVLPEIINSHQSQCSLSFETPALTNQLNSNVNVMHSAGPTIKDIETALSLTNQQNIHDQSCKDSISRFG